jgi:hypothetical protein
LKDYLLSHSFCSAEEFTLVQIDTVNSYNDYIVYISIGILFVVSYGIRIMTRSTSIACTMKAPWNVNKLRSVVVPFNPRKHGDNVYDINDTASSMSVSDKRKWMYVSSTKGKM